VEDLAFILSEFRPRNPAGFFMKLNVEFVILTPGRNGLGVYIATDHGYALHIDTYSEHPPLASLKIKFGDAKAVNLYKIIDSNKISLKVLLDMAQIKLSKDEIVEAKVVLRKDIDAVDEVRKLCNKFVKPLYTERA